MGFRDYISKKLLVPPSLAVCEQLSSEVMYKKIAVDTCVDLIANSLTRCRFETYENGKKSRDRLYYQLNVKPNKNQNAKEFYKKMVYRLFYDNECLIIQTNEGELLVADSFVVEERAVVENRYSYVSVNGYQFNQVFMESKVIYLKLSESDIMSVINSLYSSYGKLLNASMNIYKRSNAKRFVLKGNFFKSQKDKTQKAANDMMNEQMKPWLEADNAGSIFQLQDSYSLEDMSGSGKSGSNKNDSRDISNLVDDIFNYVARAFHVPSGLLKGDIAGLSDQIDSFLAFRIIPLAEFIETEFNAKFYTEQDYLNRTFLKVDSSKLKVSDITKLATAVDKMFSIGVMSIDDAIEACGGEPFNEEWSQRRFVTKNYADAKSLVDLTERDLKGGESDESNKNGNEDKGNESS